MGFLQIPLAWIWDFAAFGTEYPGRNPKIWLGRQNQIHDKSLVPASIDTTGNRWNAYGVSDMFGNVWEWCASDVTDFDAQISVGMSPRLFRSRSRHQWYEEPEIRGGSFLDNLAKTTVFLSSSQIPDEADTRHSDLGFRIAAAIEIDSLPPDLRGMLSYKEYELHNREAPATK